MGSLCLICTDRLGPSINHPSKKNDSAIAHYHPSLVITEQHCAGEGQMTRH